MSTEGISEPESQGPPPAGAGPAVGLQPERILGLAIVAGLGAGLVSWAIGEGLLLAYRSDLNPRLQAIPDPATMRRLDAARVGGTRVINAALGGSLGVALGLAGGWARRSLRAGAIAGLLGCVLGIVIGAGVATVLVPLFYHRFDPHSGDLALPLLTHAALWSAAGAAGGLAFGLGLGGRWPTAALGGLVGAMLAAAVYEVVAAMVFPGERADRPMPESLWARVVAAALAGPLTAAGAALALRSKGRRG